MKTTTKKQEKEQVHRVQVSWTDVEAMINKLVIDIKKSGEKFYPG